MLPIDGRPVVVTLVHELAAAGCEPIVVVTGHLAEQVEALLAPLPYDIRFVRSRERLGLGRRRRRAQARRRRTSSSAADTRFADGDLARFAAAATVSTARLRYGASRSAGCSAIEVADGRVLRVEAPEPERWSARRSGPRPAVARFLDPLPGKPPHELPTSSSWRSTPAPRVCYPGGRTRDLTTPADLVRENFAYLR